MSFYICPYYYTKGNVNSIIKFTRENDHDYKIWSNTQNYISPLLDKKLTFCWKSNSFSKILDNFIQ